MRRPAGDIGRVGIWYGDIDARDPMAMATGQKTLAEALPGRSLLG